MIIAFFKPQDKYGFLSNRYQAEFDIDGKHFLNSEQAFMYKKAILFNDTDTAYQILKTANPAKCKELGRMVRNFDSAIFDKEKFLIMVKVNYEKFSQNPDLKVELLYTEDATLVEASPTDKIWGIGMSADNPNIQNPRKWRGQNLLGKALMNVRDKIYRDVDEDFDLFEKEYYS